MLSISSSSQNLNQKKTIHSESSDSEPIQTMRFHVTPIPISETGVVTYEWSKQYDTTHETLLLYECENLFAKELCPKKSTI